MKESIQNNRNLQDIKKVEVVERILSKNDKEANTLREIWREKNLYVVNLMSSPGSGKTTFLENLAKNSDLRFAVLEGDLETNRDADRLKKLGVEAYQITTGTACHLEAKMISNALPHLNTDNIDFLFIENVGNLVCPASYDLGAHLNISLLSVPEGDDKVLKYPTMFRVIDALFITKWDLINYFDFDKNRVSEDLKKLKPEAEILTIDSRSKEGSETAARFLKERREIGYTSGQIFI